MPAASERGVALTEAADQSGVARGTVASAALRTGVWRVKTTLTVICRFVRAKRKNKTALLTRTRRTIWEARRGARAADTHSDCAIHRRDIAVNDWWPK